MCLQLLLFLGACITSTLAQADEEYLNAEILPICFEEPTLFNGGFAYVNGQTEPLANSLENFLSLVEKLELYNPNLSLQDELFILLKNYTAENVYYQPSENTGILSIWKPSPVKLITFEQLWEKNDKELPSHIDPFEKNEKCSLFFMLSHTVNTTNDSKYQKSYSTREQGVVALNNSKTHAVALGRVLLGLYVGLKEENERIKPVDSYPSLKKDKIRNIKNVDILYLVTLADQLAISQFALSDPSKSRLGKNGFWKSVELATTAKTKDGDSPICPVIYEFRENDTSAFTYSSVRGGIDGLILGDVIRRIRDNQPDVRLTQILRMYYGHNGLQEPNGASSSLEKISFCSRISKMALKENDLKNQIKVFLAFVSLKQDDTNTENNAFMEYDTNKGSIHLVDNDFENRCNFWQNNKGTPACEAAIDVIFVMDSKHKNVENGIKYQKEIIGHLANHLEMVHEGSTMTVFSDEKNNTSEFDLVTVIPKTTSSACAACSIMQYKESGVQVDRDSVIQSVNKVLRDVKEEEKTLSGAKGKVVIFFNFEEEENTISVSLRKALRDLYMQHIGVQFFAIGNNKDVLKTYAQGQFQNVITVLNLFSYEIAETLAKKICEVPSELQYDDCKDGRNERNAVYKGLITPNSIQRWAMYPKYFHKSFTPKFFFDSKSTDSRQIQVCHSRAYSLSEKQENHCQKTDPSKRRIEFYTTNPCRAFNQYNCAPWFFTVSVVNETSSGDLHSNMDYCKDSDVLRCKTLDQVQFEVSHEGIRCSSGSRLFSSKDLLLASLAAYIVFKFWNVNK